ncbi:putative multi-drug efflux transporter [Streptomyces nigrescens]|uniref:Multi-drug efflux transporter n=2 Tax=Streptomyces TaxID=1883 RepID=A0ABN6R643_STRNI|nr:MFS transporter [Streptomyces nigrescens]MEE4421657.1 MFS transporter [Streptomyces sp. DSM 41528]BDM72530.1 putative multi-drug efflux transporter [Streptomyces nigrescens]
MPGTPTARPEARPAASPAPAAATALPPVREVWFAAWPVVAIFVLSNAAMPLYAVWQRQLGFSSGTLTLVYAAYVVGLLGALLVAGVASDRLGRKPVLVPALLLALVACLVYATAPSVAALALARLLTGVATGAAVSAGMAAVTDLAAGRRIGPLLASTAMVLGAGIGPVLAGVLSETAPAPTVTVFVVEGVLLVTALAAVVRMPLPARGGTAGTAPGAWVRLPAVPRANRRHLALGLAAFAPGISATAFVLSLGPSLLAGLLGTTDRALAGGLALAMFLSATGVQFALRRLAVRTVLLASGAATVTGTLALVTAVRTGTLAPLVVAVLLAGAGQGAGQLGGLTLLSREVPAARRAEANAALNAGGYLLAGVLPVADGYLSDAIGLPAAATTFGLAVAALAAGGAVLVALRGGQAR